MGGDSSAAGSGQDTSESMTKTVRLSKDVSVRRTSPNEGNLSESICNFRIEENLERARGMQGWRDRNAMRPPLANLRDVKLGRCPTNA